MEIENNKKAIQEATFGAGCFWGVEDAFRLLPGVIETEVGFMGGHVPDASYEEVCRGTTGHAEVVHLLFDPQKVSYRELLKKFWEVHDPTQYHRQGPDIGEQYRSVIFYYTEQQKKEAEASRDEEEEKGNYNGDIVTEITQAGPFYRAEEYHQQYFAKNGGGTCHV